MPERNPRSKDLTNGFDDGFAAAKGQALTILKRWHRNDSHILSEIEKKIEAMKMEP